MKEIMETLSKNHFLELVIFLFSISSSLFFSLFDEGLSLLFNKWEITLNNGSTEIRILNSAYQHYFNVRWNKASWLYQCACQSRYRAERSFQSGCCLQAHACRCATQPWEKQCWAVWSPKHLDPTNHQLLNLPTLRFISCHDH